MSNPNPPTIEETHAAGSNINPVSNRFTERLSHVLGDLGRNGIFIALIAVAEAGLGLLTRWLSASIGEGLHLRTRPPRLRRIDMPQSDEGFQRRGKSGVGRVVSPESHQDKRRHAFAAEPY
jgi:hypothetical protein